MPETCLARLEAAAATHAARLAIHDGTDGLTYAELWQAAGHMARRIGATVPPGRPLAVLLPNIAAYPVAWLACLRAGRPAALLDIHYPPERLRQCLADAAPGAVIGRTDDPAARTLAGTLPYLPIEDAFAPPRQGPAPIPLADDEPAFIIFTSGSTGRPKGVALSAGAALFRADTLIDTAQMSPDDAVLSAIPPCVLGGVLNLFETFLAGAALLKLDLPRAAVTAHADRGMTMLFAPPALLRVFAQLDPDFTLRQRLRLVQPVGDAMLPADLAALRADLPPGCRVLNAYGSSEALVSLQWIIPDPYDRQGAKVAAGYPVPGYAVALLREDGSAAETGEPGELVVRSRHMARGLWRDGTLHPGPFAPDPADPASRIHATGDLAVREADGVFTVIGRRDRQIKIRGNRVEPAEIEAALRALPAIADAVVLGRAGPGETELVAFIVPAPTAGSLSRGALSQALRGVLPGYMHPTRCVALPSLPLLPNGKIDAVRLLAVLED